MTSLPTFDLSHSWEVNAYVMSDAFVSGIKGPVGSGKSVGSGIKMLRHASEMPPDMHGYRRSRCGVIRNTYPELRSTTIPTWEDIFLESRVPAVVFSAPIKHRITIPPVEFKWLDKEKGLWSGHPGFDLQVWFLALDKPSDVKRLKSMEMTFAFINEASETSRALIDMLTARVGRYPKLSTVPAGAFWSGIFYDTNAADETVWTEDFEANGPPKVEVELPDGTMFEADWAFFVQPPAVLEVDAFDKISEAGHERLGEEVRRQRVMASAGRRWTVSPDCENFANLKAGYYHQQLTNKTLDWIQRYLQAKRIYIADGLPWIPEFSQTHMVRPVRYDSSLPLFVGMDAGGGTLNPAAIWGQVGRLGDWRTLAELVIADIGLDRFVEALMRHHAQKFPEAAIETLWVDPAAATRDEVYEVAVLEYLIRKKLPARLAPTNDQKARREAIALPMGRAIHLPDGNMVPGFLVDPSCTKLIAALAGKWCKKVIERAGGRGVMDRPVKNEHSHPGDGLGYLLSGGGEYAVLTKGRKPGQPVSTLAKRAAEPGGIRINVEHDI